MNSFLLFIVSSLLFVGCEAALYTPNQPRNPYYYLLSYIGIYQVINALASEEFWKMQKAMIRINTQAFGINGGEI